MTGLKDAMPVAFNTPEIRFDCPEERKFGAIGEVKAHLAAEGADVDDIDGVRVKHRGRLVARPRLEHPGRARGPRRGQLARGPGAAQGHRAASSSAGSAIAAPAGF